MGAADIYRSFSEQIISKIGNLPNFCFLHQGEVLTITFVEATLKEILGVFCFKKGTVLPTMQDRFWDSAGLLPETQSWDEENLKE